MKTSDPTFVLTRTPLRVSFAGGGTDLAAFYDLEYGSVLSTAINKYIYVTVKRHGDIFNEAIPGASKCSELMKLRTISRASV